MDSNPKIVVVSLVEASQYYVYGAVEFFLVGYLKEVAQVDAFSLGIVSWAQLAMIPLIKPFMGRLSDKIGRGPPIVAGSLIGALAIASTTFTTQFPLLLLISVIYGIGFSLVTSSTPPLVSELAQESLVGTSMGFLGTVMDLGQTLGPIVTGLILGAGLGYVGAFSALAAIILLACGVFVLGKVTRTRR